MGRTKPNTSWPPTPNARASRVLLITAQWSPLRLWMVMLGLSSQGDILHFQSLKDVHMPKLDSWPLQHRHYHLLFHLLALIHASLFLGKKYPEFPRNKLPRKRVILQDSSHCLRQLLQHPRRSDSTM